VKRLLQAFGLPITIPTDVVEVTRFVRYDKKIQSGQIRFVLLRGIGEASLEFLESLAELETALAACT
jgi:3-dehydroquinate synthetase